MWDAVLSDPVPVARQAMLDLLAVGPSERAFRPGDRLTYTSATSFQPVEWTRCDDGLWRAFDRSATATDEEIQIQLDLASPNLGDDLELHRITDKKEPT